MSNYTDKDIEEFETISRMRDIKDENWEMYENAEDFFEKEEERKQILLSLIREKSDITLQKLLKSTAKRKLSRSLGCH